jgi:hypothetical protein
MYSGRVPDPLESDHQSYSNSKLTWDEKELVIDISFPQGGKEMLWHEVWSDITSKSFTQTGDMAEVGGPLKRAVTIKGTRVPD